MVSVTTSNEDLANALLDQQSQIGKLSELFGSLSSACVAQSEVLSGLQEQLLGVRAAFQVFAELVMASSPEFKRMVATASSQILARPDAANNQTLRELVEALNAAATSESRTTPEGRRAGFQVVPHTDPSSET
jgi:hypothetical protein